MTTTNETTTAIDTNTSASEGAGLAEDIRESAKAGQHAASEALHKFRQTLDEAIPGAVHPLRTRIVDAAIELADDLVTAQFKFNRSIVRSADRALTKADDEARGKNS
jgi:precorrin-6x reductase